MRTKFQTNYLRANINSNYYGRGKYLLTKRKYEILSEVNVQLTEKAKTGLQQDILLYLC